MPSLPSGTVTFLFSDIEGSTELLKQLGDDFAKLLADHRRILRDSFGAHDGQEIDTQGDAFFYAFPRAHAAVAGAVQAQRALAAHEWPGGGPVRVRIGLHTGEPALGEEGYTGIDVVRAARIGAIAAGGQVLLSETTRALASADMPDGVDASPLGPRRLRGIDKPEPISTLVIPDLPLPSSATAGSGIEARLSADGADQARHAIERRVLADLERSVADAEAGKSGGWSHTVRWVLVTIVIVFGAIAIVGAIVGLLQN